MNFLDYYKKIIWYIIFYWQNKIVKYAIYTFLGAIFTFLILNIFFLRAPSDLPIGSIFSLEKGSSLNKISSELYSKHIIRSEFFFKIFTVLEGGSKGIMAGDYMITKKQNVFTVARRLSSGVFELTAVKILIPEGFNIFEISKLVTKKIGKINSDYFTNLASPDEGYLFPDTYYFLPNASAEEIISVMKDNFQKKISLITNEITAFKKPLTDIIKMASILEEEAKTTESRKMVAGILWKRLSLGIPLQVDSSFKYINGKVTKDLSLQDLKIDSPYNSYLYKGLPPTPIANPGLDSINAAISPTKTEYLFFLSDENGEMHYAKTFEEHLVNKEKYL